MHSLQIMNKTAPHKPGDHYHQELAQLRLLQLISPNLPTGAFTYSQGMEWAVECHWINNIEETQHWLSSILTDSLARLELPLLLRLANAAQQQNAVAFSHWSRWLYACRETHELRQEEKQRARALYSLLCKLPDATSWKELTQWKSALLNSQMAGYALASYHWQLDHRQLLLSYCWSWLENAVAVAIKLVPLGQSQGQQLLYDLSESVIHAVDFAENIKDQDISSSSCAMAIASSRHETQYSRLFRS